MAGPFIGSGKRTTAERTTVLRGSRDAGNASRLAIWTTSMTDAAGIRAANGNGLGFDEVTRLPGALYRYLCSRVRKSRSVPLRIRQAANPGDIGHEWVKAASLTDDGSGTPVCVPAKARDNPFLNVGNTSVPLPSLIH